ncbi:hypothetical protein Tco_1089548, partial [Tanacetum coccineum]
MLKTIIHAQTIQKRLDDKKLQIQECTVQEVKALDAISEDKAKKSCMVSFRKLHSHLKHLSHDNLKGTRTESGFKRAFATLFGQDIETFTGTMFLYVDQLEKQLDKEEFQEIESMAAFKYWRIVSDKSIDERAQHKREYDSWQWTNIKEQDTSSMSGNDADADDADIRPIYDEEPMLKNDMVHNHYLEEAKKKTQESSRNSEPSVMPSARSQSTANGSKPKPRINNQKSRNWPASKSSCVTTKTVPIAEHSRNSRNFSDSKHFVCSTCQKCVFNANHDHCVTKFLNEVNSRAKVPSNKTTNRNKPVEQTSFAKKPERQIPKGHRFSIKKTSVVHEKTMTPRSCLRWKPTGKIFKTVGLRWVPTGKIFTTSTTKVDSEPPNGSNEDITNPYECEQTLNVSAVKFKAGSKSCSSNRQDNYIMTRVGITIPLSHSNAKDN